MDVWRILWPVAVTVGVTLTVVGLAMRAWLLHDAKRAIESLSRVEADVRKKEEAVRRQIEEHEREFAQRRADLEADLQRRAEEAQKEVSRLREQMMAEAKREADRILANARQGEERLRAQVMAEMEDKAAHYAGEVLKLVCSEAVTAAVNHQFTDELLHALEEIDAASIVVDGSDQEFVSSHPMEPEQKVRLEKILADKFGLSVHVQEKVRPELLAGMIIKLGSLEIDGSLLNRCREAAAEVRKTGIR